MIDTSLLLVDTNAVSEPLSVKSPACEMVDLTGTKRLQYPNVEVWGNIPAYTVKGVGAAWRRMSFPQGPEYGALGTVPYP